MRQIRHTVAGAVTVTNVAETSDDLRGFRDFVRANLHRLAFDTETTGLDIYSPGFKIRLAQFGNHLESWVIPVELGGAFEEDVRLALKGIQSLVIHNAAYDLQVVEKTLGIPMEELWYKVTDTRILSHLVDSRGKKDGGVGHSLDELTSRYIDAKVAEEVKGSMSEIAKEYKTTKNKIWPIVDLGHQGYNLYAGMDVILTFRLYQVLFPMVPGRSRDLIPYEHKLAEVCCKMTRNGFLLDVDYTEGLSAELLKDEEYYKDQAKLFGCENVNSTEQVADVIESQGFKIKGRTPSGKRKVDSALLDELADGGDRFAKVVILAKKAGKWRKTWVENFLSQRDDDDRCHASINTLAARTGRMSITGIPAQTLPSGKGEWTIRRCFIAEPDHRIVSVDYQTQELRVLAALSGDRVMLDAFENGLDLHQITAEASGVGRPVGKMANFLTVYGGGPGALSDQAGIELSLAKEVLEGFNRTYPGVAAYSKRRAQDARTNGYIYTNTGRRLVVDSARAYSGLNYDVQSASRDVTGRALIRLDQKGYTPYLRLPIHDEVLASLPAEHAEWGSMEIAGIMQEEMGPVTIGTDAEVGLRSWGSLYGADY